jgi:hypothetical protein
MGDGPNTKNAEDPEKTIIYYFDHFTRKNPKGRVLDIQNPDVTIVKVLYDENDNPVISIHGKYVFTMDDPDTHKRIDVACRYGYNIVKEDGEWKWGHHNSEVLPSSQLQIKKTPAQEQTQASKFKLPTP